MNGRPVNRASHCKCGISPPKCTKSGHAGQDLPPVQHMQPARRLIGGDAPPCCLVQCIKLQRQTFLDRAPAVGVNLEATNRAAVVVQYAGVFHEVKIGSAVRRARDVGNKRIAENCEDRPPQRLLHSGHNHSCNRVGGVFRPALCQYYCLTAT